MNIGVSTACLYPMESEKALGALLGMGFRHFEFFINSAVETRQPFLRDFREVLRDSGATLRSVHPFTCILETALFFGDYARRFEDGLDFYKRYCEAAVYLGARLMVLHGQRPYPDGSYMLSDGEYCDRYLRLYRACKEEGITLCQENVVNWRGGTTRFIRTMRRELADECAFVFDIKQCLLAREQPKTMLDAMGEKLLHVHISDSTAERPCLLPGRGDYDLAAVAEKLKEMHYKESVIIEVYSSSYGDAAEIEDAGKYIKKLF